MPEKKPTYCINESVLRTTLLGYSVEVDPSRCDAIAQEVSNIRMQKTFKMPSTKMLVRFVVLPLLLITAGSLVYFNFDAIQGAFTPLPEPAKLKTETKVAVPAVIKTQTVAVTTIPTPVANVAVQKKDTIQLAVNKITDTAKEQTNKQANPVIAAPPVDSATSGKSENKVTKSDSVSQKADQPVKKKKKRRRRSDAYIDDVKESSLQPNSADDDVVVPQ